MSAETVSETVAGVRTDRLQAFAAREAQRYARGRPKAAEALAKGAGAWLGGGVAEHRPGIAEAEIVDAETVDVDDPCAFGPVDQRQMRHRPIGHPMHRNPAQPGPGAA